jgi:transcription termination factor Rho
MNNEPLDSPVSVPRKRTPRKIATTARTTVRKPRTKKIDDEIPESFSAAPGITCEYSDLILFESAEDWSPQKLPEALPAVTAATEEQDLGMPDVSGDHGERRSTCRRQLPCRSSDDGVGRSGEREPRLSCDGSSADHRKNTESTNDQSNGNGGAAVESRPNNPVPHGRRESAVGQAGYGVVHGNLKNSQNAENFRNANRNAHQNSLQNRPNRRRSATTIRIGPFSIGYLRGLECFDNRAKLEAFYGEVVDETQPPLHLNEILNKSDDNLADFASSIDLDEASSRGKIIDNCMKSALAERRPILIKGILESMEGGDGIITYGCDCYKIRAKSTFVPRCLIQSLGLRRGQTLTATVHPPLEQSTCPFAIGIGDVLGKTPEEAAKFPRFKDLMPYYPTERIFLERRGAKGGDNLSMRVIDLLSPIGFGQRGLIVAPPRTGKTVLLQNIANAIIYNQPEAKLIVLLIDERPEEVTDFSRQVHGAEVISSTFDESADSHIHAAEIVIENGRRWVEAGEHVVILLDSITRLARAYNAEQPSSGKILSGGVEANALQLPKRFFGSARNIEGGGSLTIIATALVETGSRMDDVIFEEFKGTGNMELHLDRSIADKRIFPAINLERSGTRKEELLYHPDELAKVYNLRRAFLGVPSLEALEMLIARVRKYPTNVEFLMNINR